MNVSDATKFEKTIIDALRRKGYKATPQRIAICSFALQSHDHPTAQQIYNQVQKDHPTVSLATIYKTLQVLQELNLVQEMGCLEGQARFDPLMSPHINLICSQCGEIRDLVDQEAQNVVMQVSTVGNFLALGQRIDIYGICNKCGRKSE